MRKLMYCKDDVRACGLGCVKEIFDAGAVIAVEHVVIMMVEVSQYSPGGAGLM